MVKPTSRGTVRLIGPRGQRGIKREGYHRNIFSDIYHFLLKTSWPIFLLIWIGLLGLINAIFACAYLVGGDIIANAHPGSFADAFFFSVQTMATLGYGVFYPRGVYANLVSVLETFIGLLSLALVTGMTFAKFSRPTARILFSRVAVVAMRNGAPHLMFRMANARTNLIVEAHLVVGVLLNETSQEGQALRRFHEMKLIRDQTPVFGLSWIVFHPIDAESPLFGQDLNSLEEKEAEIVVSLSGVDDTLLQTVHQQHSYLPEDLKWNAVFSDILLRDPQGKLYMDYRQFQNIRMLAPEDPGFIP